LIALQTKATETYMATSTTFTAQLEELKEQGDKYSLKRGIYNVDESRIRPKEKPGAAMGQVGL
jgi:hypothetical protein